MESQRARKSSDIAIIIAMRADTDLPVVAVFGVVALACRRGVLQVALVQDQNGPSGHSVLGFPKGHPRIEELPAETAARECWEETGLDVLPVRMLGRVRRKSIEEWGQSVVKDIWLFLALVQYPQQIARKGIWVPLRSVASTLTFAEDIDFFSRHFLEDSCWNPL